MSRNLVLYVDGSHCAAKGGQNYAIGWGMVALHNDEHHEATGSRLLKKQDTMRAYFEAVAFIDGVLYACKHGFDFHNVTIYTDCEVFGNGPTLLHPDNYSGSRGEQLMTRIHTVAAHIYKSRDIVQLVVQFMAQARVVKLKGHSFHVYQERTDYLAKIAARNALAEGEPREVLTMDDWLQRGVMHYAPSKKDPKEYVATWWKAPFVSA